MSKQAIAITTSTHAAHLLALAVTRLAKQQAEVVVTQGQIAEYEELVKTLPAGVAAPKRTTIADGSVVTFEHGREAGRKTLEGVVVASKVKDGSVQQYKVRVGTGFDSKDYNVFPGSIKSVAGVAEPEDGDNAEADPLAGVGTDEEVDPLA